ncbi:MAG: ABC transporter permease [Thermoplasmata archaeon]
MTEPMLSDLAQWQIALRYQFRSYLRTYRFVALVATILIVQVAIFVILAHYAGADAFASNGDPSTFISGLLTFLADFIYLSAALLGGDAISTDFGGRTGYFVLVLPVRRATLLLGRFVAATLATVLITAIYILGVALTTQYFFGTVPVTPLLETALIAFLFAAASVALAFFFSSLVKNSMLSILLTVIVLIVALPIVTSILEAAAQVTPWFSLVYAGGAITEPLTGIPNGLSMGGVVLPTVAQAALIMVAYLFVFFGLSYLFYQFKEATG